MPAEIVVVGQIARDLVLRVPEVPGPGTSAEVRSRQEVLGGKGANQAVAFAQLGLPVALVGVVGRDAAGEALLAQARADRVDCSHVVRRDGGVTALIVDVVDDDGRWRYLEDISDDVLVTEPDVLAAAPLISAADSVVLQLQQPLPALLAAARVAHEAGTRVVLDGAPADPDRAGELLSRADVLRADAREAELLTGTAAKGVEDAVRAGRALLGRGPSLVVLEVAGQGNVFVEASGHEFVPLADVEVADTTGSGDALVATLTAARTRGTPLRESARLAVAAAGATASHPGGRPRLTRADLDRPRPGCAP
jgi:ribokinase